MGDVSLELSKAEQHLSDLERRISLIEAAEPIGSSSNSDETELTAFKRNIVKKLKIIRDQLVSEGGDPVQLLRERDSTLAENEKLKKEVLFYYYLPTHITLFFINFIRLKNRSIESIT